MTADDEGSVTRWLTDFKAGEHDEAFRRLCERYFASLARLAQAHLRAAVRGPADGEDVALSAFESLFRGVAAGRYPRLNDREDLWKLLTTIALRKASNQRRNERRLKRGGGLIVGGNDLAGHGDGDPLARVVGSEPTPELAITLVDEVRQRFADLPDESLRIVARMRMEGFANEEIARALDCSPRSIERKLEVIRKTWSREAGR
jgi:DNA-directed RNA polymerase specialized sigma24 family protein